MKSATLTITTWVGTVYGATHYYGRIISRLDGKRTEEEVTHKLTKPEAKSLNDWDGTNLYKAGEESARFWSREELIESALELAKELGFEVLFVGLSESCDPQQVILGPDEFMKAANTLYEQAESNDGWDGDQGAMENIYNEWEKLLKQWGIK